MTASFFDIALMASNYSHDIATALLAVSGISLWILEATYPKQAGKGAEIYYLSANRVVMRIARGSLAWVLLAGVPRVMFYKNYEWSSAAGGLQVTAILIKHVVMFLLVGMGIFYWVKIRGKMHHLSEKYGKEVR